MNRNAAIVLAVLAVAISATSAGAGRDAPKDATAKVVVPAHDLSPAEAAAHVWNRIGYGPRPGDTATLPDDAAIASWIERQFAPASIDDPAADRELAGLPLASASPVELFLAHPPPALLIATDRAASRAGIPDDALLAAIPELHEIRARQDRKAAEARKNDPLTGRRRIGVELAQAKLVRATTSERQLLEVMNDFWFNHFNVFAGKQTTVYWLGDYERNAIRAHALGNFRDLLGAVAHHPAMLIYLDNARSIDPGAGMEAADLRRKARDETLSPRDRALPPGGLVTLLLRDRGFDTERLERGMKRAASGGGRRTTMAAEPDRSATPVGLNENYARELLELHTVGVDAGYTQRDVEEVARCFTGWTLRPLTAGQGFTFDRALHDRSARTVLGQTIDAGGRAQGEAVLDLLARDPATARFVSEKLARRFVSDDPPAALVERMAATWHETDGDLRAVLVTLFSSPEFWSREAYAAKVRTPLEVVVASVRALDADFAPLPPGGEDAARMDRPGALNNLRELGHAPYSSQPPTGYGDTADDWVSAGAILHRMKLAIRLATGRIPGVRVGDPPPLDPDGGVAALAERMLGRPASAATVEAVERQLADAETTLAELGMPARPARAPGARERLAAGWVLASADFQRR